jgi:hypothetical protein
MSSPRRIREAFATPRALDVARAIGALAQVERLADAVSQNAPDSELADLRGQVNDTMSLATLDLASTVANLACEEGRTNQIAPPRRRVRLRHTSRPSHDEVPTQAQHTRRSVERRSAPRFFGGRLGVPDPSSVLEDERPDVAVTTSSRRGGSLGASAPIPRICRRIGWRFTSVRAVPTTRTASTTARTC